MTIKGTQVINGSNVLVTGGAGFVGKNLVEMLLDEGVNSIHIVDNLLSSEKVNVPENSRIIFFEGSIADNMILAQVSDEYDFIFHLCTYHGNQSSIANPMEDHDNNLLTTLKLFDHVKNFRRLKKIVYSGAGCAVAEKTFDKARATSEDAPVSLNMDSPYSISKIVGEFYALYFFNRDSLPVVRARFQNVYGPGEILGAGKWRGTPATVWRNVTPTFIYKALQKEPLPLEGGGVASRDFIYVKDIVRGLICCATKGLPGGVYNLASGVETSILELATLINQITHNPSPPLLLPKRDWDNSGHRFGDPSKALREIGFKANVSLKEGLIQTIEWTRQVMPLIEKCIAKHNFEMQRLLVR